MQTQFGGLPYFFLPLMKTLPPSERCDGGGQAGAEGARQAALWSGVDSFSLCALLTGKRASCEAAG